MSIGKARLAPPGYYISYVYHKNEIEPELPNTFDIIYINKDQKCKYIHHLFGGAWNTLTWTCAPTKKKLELSKHRKSDDYYIEVYESFISHSNMTASKFRSIIIQKYASALIPVEED